MSDGSSLPVERLPNGWRVGRLKETVQSAKNGIWGSEPDGGLFDLPCVRVADFDRVRLRASEAPTLRLVALSERNGRMLRSGDLLIEKSGGGEKQPVGCVVTYEGPPAVCSNFVARVVVDSRHHARFVTYTHAALYAAGVTARSIKQTTGIQNLDSAAYFDERVPLPPLDVQRAIANFLDRKTAALDALIDKKERLLALLQEKRQALITQAVTKGLDPNVPMKDSGVEWLGEIPAHWEVRRLKHVMQRVVDCPHSTPEYDAGGDFPAVRTSDVDRGELLLDQTRRVRREVYLERVARMVPRAGDILYSREGERFGMAALVPPGVELCLAQRMMIFRAAPAYDPAYLMWSLNADFFYQQVKQDTVGATSPRINISTIANAWLAAPPVHEQRSIAASLERNLKRVLGLRNRVAEQIDRVREYRQALITAAVTGQLDVTGERA